MRDTCTELFVHMIWATWDRLPLLTSDVQAKVNACIIAKCTDMKTKLIAIGGTEDHIHLLVRLPATLAAATFVQQMKGSSSHLITHEHSGGNSFKWQGAYAAFSVSKALVPTIKAYIQKQEEHHKNGTEDKDLEID